MHKIIIVLFLVISHLSFSQTEIVLDNNSNLSLTKARDSILNSGNGYGTIFIKKNIKIPNSKDTLILPHKITLNFSAGSKLIFESSKPVKVYSVIKSSLYPIFDLAVGHNLRVFQQKIYPEWFGEFAYQGAITNSEKERIAIQKAFDALSVGGEINFIGDYYQVSNAIDINRRGIRIKGKGAYLSKSCPTNYITTTNQSAESSIFNILINGVRLSGLNFRGATITNKGIEAKGIALNYIRSNGSKDVDAAISGCMIEHFRYGIYGEGANLKISDNTFTSCYIGVYINEAKKDGMDKAHTRGHVIDRNRFHSIGSYYKDISLDGSTCIKIWGNQGYAFPESGITNSPESYLGRGYYNQISNNYADDCKTFFDGILDRTKIDGNSILSSGDTAIKAFGGLYGAVINNTIDGSFTWNPNKLYSQKVTDSQEKFPSGHGIHVNNADFLTIHNNQILNKRFHGIYIERSRNTSIQSNTILNFNRHRFIKEPGKNFSENDEREYDGIHIKRIGDRQTEKYNINNIVSNNVIAMPHAAVEGRYAIYMGDGDPENLLKNNFINEARIREAIKIEK